MHKARTGKKVNSNRIFVHVGHKRIAGCRLISIIADYKPI